MKQVKIKLPLRALTLASGLLPMKLTGNFSVFFKTVEELCKVPQLF